MPYGFSFGSARPQQQVAKVGHPKRDRSKSKASRRANRARRR